MITKPTEKSTSIAEALVLGLLVATLVAALLAAEPAHAARTFTVNNAGDPGDGNCSATLGCTLREAILAANANPNAGGADVIAFDIPNTGVQTIKPTSELPVVTEAVIVNGYTQPGSTPNTLAKGTDARPLIEIDGSNLGSSGDGLKVQTPNTTTVIRGLVVNRFGDTGIQITSGPGVRGGRVTLEGNFVGTDPTGTVAEGNSGNGIVAEGASVLVGGGTPASRNLISGNGDDGILISGSRSSLVLGNLIGTKRGGISGLGNADNGVGISNSDNVSVGSELTRQANIIAFNGDDGIEVIKNGSSANQLQPNSIFANGDLGIDLGDDGPTTNDVGDADAGPNGFQNKPVINSSVTSGTKTTVRGKLNGKPGINFAVHFFSNPSGNEGKVFLGRTDVTTNANGNVSFSFSPAQSVPAGQRITASATSLGDGTSEFSAPRRVVAS